MRHKPPSLLILLSKISLNDLPNSAVHTSGFRGEDGSTVELNVVCLVDIVFSYANLSGSSS
jgi:hypothetical protein